LYFTEVILTKCFVGLAGRKEDLVVFRKQVVGMNEQALARFVARARRAVKLRGMVTVLITSNAEMKKLNLCFRSKNKATDVLSFAAADNPKSDNAGDVAISLEIARENAKSLGHAVSDEIKILILHGILHLAGYDHETDGGEMAAREHGLRKVLRLPVTLIERNAEVPQRSLKNGPPAAARKTGASPGKIKQKTGRKRRS
jgi:probable rRNA maturation factor